jgi:hypothetical protein
MTASAARDGTIIGRKLTAVVYLNEHWEGGQLRIHQSDGVVDVEPSLGRIVLFRRWVHSFVAADPMPADVSIVLLVGCCLFSPHLTSSLIVTRWSTKCCPAFATAWR